LGGTIPGDIGLRGEDKFMNTCVLGQIEAISNVVVVIGRGFITFVVGGSKNKKGRGYTGESRYWTCVYRSRNECLKGTRRGRMRDWAQKPGPERGNSVAGDLVDQLLKEGNLMIVAELSRNAGSRSGSISALRGEWERKEEGRASVRSGWEREPTIAKKAIGGGPLTSGNAKTEGGGGGGDWEN